MHLVGALGTSLSGRIWRGPGHRSVFFSVNESCKMSKLRGGGLLAFFNRGHDREMFMSWMPLGLYWGPSGWKRTTPKAKISAWNGAGSWVLVVVFCFFSDFLCWRFLAVFWGIRSNYCKGSKTEFGFEKIITPGTSDESIWSTGQWEHNQNTSASNPFHKSIHHHISTRLFSSKSWRIPKNKCLPNKTKK